MPLDKGSIEWAISHLSILGDSDLFPKPIELSPLLDQSMGVKSTLDSCFVML
jgi:hypothetical protein